MKTEPTNESTIQSEYLHRTLVENLAIFRAFALKRLGDPELAADVVQEAVLKTLRAETQLEDGDNVVAWFYRILRNTITDLHRRKSVQARALEQFGHELDAGPDEEAREVICHCLSQLLPSLKPEYAEVVRRIDFGEEPTTKVAASLGVSPGNLKVRLHRARQQLKERLVETCQMCATHGCLNCECPPNPKS